jgi:hypothetical protein
MSFDAFKLRNSADTANREDHGLRLLLHDVLVSPRRRKFFPPLGLLVHRRGDLEVAVEIE